VDHLTLLPASAAAAGRLEDAVCHMHRLRADIARQFHHIKFVMQTGGRSLPAVREYNALHQAIDALCSLMIDDQEFRIEASQHLTVLENGLASRFWPTTRRRYFCSLPGPSSWRSG
jgi:hypothetical protein